MITWRIWIGIVGLTFWTMPSSAWEYREIRDVSVQCSNGLTCVLRLKVIGDGAGALQFGLHRSAGEGVDPEIVFETGKPFRSDSQIDISVDGKPVAAIPVSALTDEDSGWRWRLKDNATVITILDAMRSGSRLETAGTTEDGLRQTVFSLSGVVGGLIFMDEVQGRLETPDALQVKGTSDRKPVAAREITAIDQIPAAIRPQFSGNGECSFMNPERLSYASGFEVATGDDGYLIVLPCAEGGAYNQPYVLFSRFGEEAWPVPVPFMDDEGPSAERMIWNVGYNHSEKTVTGFFKGRGIGDCGVYNRWKLSDGPAGVRLVLVEARAKGDCDGDYAGGPENWPRHWPPEK